MKLLLDQSLTHKLPDTLFPGENADDGDSAALVKSDGTVELLGSSPVDLTAFVEAGDWVTTQ